MGKRLLRPRSNSAGAKVQVSSPHTLSQGGTQMLISEDNNNKNINQDLDQHMDNTTLPATADSLVQSQTEENPPHVTDNGHTPTEMEVQSRERQTQTLVKRDKTAPPPMQGKTTQLNFILVSVSENP